MIYTLLGLSIILSSLAQLFQKRASALLDGRPLIKVLFASDTLLALTCLATSFVFWVIVLTELPVSTAYPLLSLSYVIVTAIAHFYFHEKISLRRIGGVAMICTGAALLA